MNNSFTLRYSLWMKIFLTHVDADSYNPHPYSPPHIHHHKFDAQHTNIIIHNHHQQQQCYCELGSTCPPSLVPPQPIITHSSPSKTSSPACLVLITILLLLVMLRKTCARGRGDTCSERATELENWNEQSLLLDKIKNWWVFALESDVTSMRQRFSGDENVSWSSWLTIFVTLTVTCRTALANGQKGHLRINLNILDIWVIKSVHSKCHNHAMPQCGIITQCDNLRDSASWSHWQSPV